MTTENNIKLCNKCKNLFPLTSEYWPVKKKNKNGLDTPCRDCCRLYMKYRRSIPELKEKDRLACKEWYRKNPKSTTKRNRLLKFGIDQDRYNVLLLEQNYKCAICGNQETSTINGQTKSLAVDHCHKTNKVRGLLCSRCNTSIGLAKDNVDVLYKMIEYLKRNL